MIKSFSFEEKDFKSELQTVLDITENKSLLKDMALSEINLVIIDGLHKLHTEFSFKISEPNITKFAWIAKYTQLQIFKKIDSLLNSIEYCRNAIRVSDEINSKEFLCSNKVLYFKIEFKKKLLLEIINVIKCYDKKYDTDILCENMSTFSVLGIKEYGTLKKFPNIWDFWNRRYKINVEFEN